MSNKIPEIQELKEEALNTIHTIVFEYKESNVSKVNMALYTIALECLYEMDESALESLHQACLDILFDRRM